MTASAQPSASRPQRDRSGALCCPNAEAGGSNTPVVVNAVRGPAKAVRMAENLDADAPIKPTQNQRVSGYERDPDDWYVENAACVETLFDNINFDEQTIWDPACGGGNIPRVATEYGFDTLATDKVDRGCGARVLDFIADELSTIELPPRLSIVTNPPYKLSEAFIRRALSLVDHRVAVLVPLSFLASARRFDLFTEFPPSDVLVLCKRPSMPPGTKIAEMGKKAHRNGMVDFGWLIWTKPHDRETRTRWAL